MISMLHVLHPFFGDTNTIQIAAGRVTHVWEWYAVRAAGFLAAALMMLLMVSGIGLVTGLTFRVFEPTKAWVIHKALAFALIASIIIHIVFIVLDKYVTFTIPQVLIPFLSTYKRTSLFGSIWVALGILAMYGTFIIVLSSLGYVNWIEKKKALWKLIHYLGYVVMFFVFLHALYAGTDLARGPLRALWLLAGAILLLAVATRLLRAGTLKAKESEGIERKNNKDL